MEFDETFKGYGGERPRTYSIGGQCSNCDFCGEINLPFGEPVPHRVKCPNCGCESFQKNTPRSHQVWLPHHGVRCARAAGEVRSGDFLCWNDTIGGQVLEVKEGEDGIPRVQAVALPPKPEVSIQREW